MNHLLRGPVFSFGPDDDLTSTQLQSQRSNAPALGPLGTWQQCHLGMSSFYGPPAGLSGSFISPPGGITGLAGPPHMVVYNHLAPVGQFGQVGLSFMGAYISSGKQPDWKHDSTSSGLGDMTNLNLVPGQHNPANMPAPVQHFAPGSPLLPMASPMTIFDVSPFQPSLDMLGQARWPRVPASSFQSVSQSMPIQQQTEGVLPAQFCSGSSVDHSSTAKRFPDSRISAVLDQFYLTTDASVVVHLPEELGIIDASMSANGSNMIDGQNGCDVKFNGQNSCSTLKIQAGRNQIGSSEQYGQPSGYSYHRGGRASQKTSAGGWSHRKAGFQGKNQSSGTEKNLVSSKVKQIYVAKQTTNAKPIVP